MVDERRNEMLSCQTATRRFSEQIMPTRYWLWILYVEYAYFLIKLETYVEV